MFYNTIINSYYYNRGVLNIYLLKSLLLSSKGADKALIGASLEALSTPLTRLTSPRLNATS